MNSTLVAAAALLDALGYGDWQLEVRESHKLIDVRHVRKLVILSETAVNSASAEELVNQLYAALCAPEQAQWQAVCPSCGRQFNRDRPAVAVHHCFTCGPVAGMLEFK